MKAQVTRATFEIMRGTTVYRIEWDYERTHGANAGITKTDINVYFGGGYRMTFTRELRASKKNAVEILNEYIDKYQDANEAHFSRQI